MMKTKRIISMLLTLFLLMTMNTSVFAGHADVFQVTLDPGVGGGEPAGGGGLLPSVNPTPPDGIENMSKPVLTMIRQVGMAVAAGMMVYVGIKYVMASANEKADLKNASIKYVFGAIILLSVTSAFAIVEKLMLQIAGS